MFARLALTFHLIDVAEANASGNLAPYTLVVPANTARRAASFMLDVALPHLLRADAMMFSTAQTGHARWIAGYILAHGLKQVTARDVVRAYGALRSPEARAELGAVMASLVTIGWLEPEPPDNPMKPVHLWEVNPAVHVLFAAKADRERVRREEARENLATHVDTLRRRRARAEAA